MRLAGFTDISEILRAGVYALAYRGCVVYVGKSKNLYSRIYTHRDLNRKGRSAPSWLPVKGITFDEVFIRPCRTDQLDALEREMINLYKPTLNQRLKTTEKVSSPIALSISGVEITVNAPAQTLERRI